MVVTGDLTGGRFSAPPAGILFENARVVGVDFSDQRFSRFEATGSVFESCIFDRVRINRGSLSGPPPTLYRGCHFAGTQVGNPGLARFEDCEFVDAKIDNWDCYQNDFVGCRFAGHRRGVSFCGSKFRSLPGMEPTGLPWYRHDNQFSGNDFRAADLDLVEFLGGIEIDAQSWPDAVDYKRIDLRPEALARARVIIENWPESSRAAALEFLRWIEGHYVLQRETVRRHPMPAPEIGASWASQNDEVWALLASGPAGRPK
jgi:hypothetical protein